MMILKDYYITSIDVIGRKKMVTAYRVLQFTKDIKMN